MARARVCIACAELAELYGAGHSTIVLAQHYGCSPTTVGVQLRRCGIAVRQARFRMIDIPLSVLHELYVVQQQPLAQIAAALGVSASTVRNRCRAYGLPLRPRTRA